MHVSPPVDTVPGTEAYAPIVEFELKWNEGSVDDIKRENSCSNARSRVQKTSLMIRLFIYFQFNMPGSKVLPFTGMLSRWVCYGQ